MLREVGAQALLVPTGAAVVDLNGLLTLNATGRWLWERLAPGRTAADLARELAAEFDVGEAEALADVEAFVAELRRTGALEP